MLLLLIRKLHPVFNVIKLITILKDLIPSKCLDSLPNPILIYRQEEWDFRDQKILNSCWYQWKYQFLIK